MIKKKEQQQPTITDGGEEKCSYINYITKDGIKYYTTPGAYYTNHKAQIVATGITVTCTESRISETVYDFTTLEERGIFEIEEKKKELEQQNKNSVLFRIRQFFKYIFRGNNQ